MSNIPTQAMLDVMNKKKNKPVASRKKKVEEIAVEEFDIPEDDEQAKPVAKKNKKAVEELDIPEDDEQAKPVAKNNRKIVKKEEAQVLARRNARKEDEEEPQTSGEIPTPAMLEYMNKKKNKQEASGTKRKGETKEVIEENSESDSGEEEPKPREKK